MLRLALLIVLCLLPVAGLGDDAPPTSPAEYAVPRFVGEEHLYSIDFLFFKRLAAGQLSFHATAEPGIFRAELMGKTLGIAAWLTRERTQFYTSRMQLMPDGRFRSLEHASRILKRKSDGWHDRGKHYRFDYALGKVFQRKSREGVFRPGDVFEIPPGSEPADILTAFYNVRSGVYGQLLPGTDLRIPTFSSKGFNHIEIHVMTPEEQRAYAFFPPGGLLLRVHVDPEVFETGSGDLYVWFNAQGEPKRGIVEDIIGMGDVRGYPGEVTHD